MSEDSGDCDGVALQISYPQHLVLSPVMILSNIHQDTPSRRCCLSLVRTLLKKENGSLGKDMHTKCRPITTKPAKQYQA